MGVTSWRIVIIKVDLTNLKLLVPKFRETQHNRSLLPIHCLLYIILFYFIYILYILRSLYSFLQIVNTKIIFNSITKKINIFLVVIFCH